MNPALIINNNSISLGMYGGDVVLFTTQILKHMWTCVIFSLCISLHEHMNVQAVRITSWELYLILFWEN